MVEFVAVTLGAPEIRLSSEFVFLAVEWLNWGLVFGEPVSEFLDCGDQG